MHTSVVIAIQGIINWTNGQQEANDLAAMIRLVDCGRRNIKAFLNVLALVC